MTIKIPYSVSLMLLAASAMAQSASFSSEADGLLWVLPNHWTFTDQKLQATLARATQDGGNGQIACTLGIDHNRPSRSGVSDEARVRGFDGSWHMRQATAVGAQALNLERFTFTRLNGKPASMAEMTYDIQSPDRTRRYAALAISAPRGTDLINFGCLVPSTEYARLRPALLAVSAGISIAVSQ